MIVEFSVQNYRSINGLQTLSFKATGLKSSKDNSEVDRQNIVEVGSEKLFKTVGIYGANASGKSNVIKALAHFILAVTREPSAKSHLASLADPYLYQNNSSDTESFFQIILMLNGEKYRYGFTVKCQENTEKDSQRVSKTEVVTNEWLYGKKEKSNGMLFTREGKKVNNKLPNKELAPNVPPYDHTLFISHVAAFDSEGVCNALRKYLSDLTISSYSFDSDKFRWMSIAYLHKSRINKKKQFLELMSRFDLRYDDIQLDDEDEFDDSKIFPQEKVNFYRDVGSESNRVELNLKAHESDGTKKMFDLAGLLLFTFSFKTPAFIILDEIDSNFHPALLIRLMKVFNDPEVNLSNSQLLFTSHDTNLMSPSIMRRDQFYFTEKDESLSTRLYSLSELKGVRNDADFARHYLSGYYGALPVLDDFKSNGSDDE
ncbi:MAG: ATP-binding protein [Flavobacteriales bacterium]|nr:ATP-binding protein [Flavobacteriales bacterium]